MENETALLALEGFRGQVGRDKKPWNILWSTFISQWASTHWNSRSSQGPLRTSPMWTRSATKTTLQSLYSVYSDDRMPLKYSLSPEAVQRTPVAWVTLAATPKAPSRFPTWGLGSRGAAGSPGSYNAGSVPAKHCAAYAALWFKQKNQGWKRTLTHTQLGKHGKQNTPSVGSTDSKKASLGESSPL